MRKRNVAIFLFDDVEVLDFAGPFEVFSAATHLHDRRPFEVYTVAARPGPITAVNGLSINPRYTLADAPAPDLLVVPGGVGTRPLVDDAGVIAWIVGVAERAELVLSVCTGSRLLARAGLLDGREATTHHTALDNLRELAPRATVRDDLRFVDAGRVMTAAGISAGIDLSLYVVGKLLGSEAARRTARYMEYESASHLSDATLGEA